MGSSSTSNTFIRKLCLSRYEKKVNGRPAARCAALHICFTPGFYGGCRMSDLHPTEGGTTCAHEAAGEQAAESGPSDGPGGYADANVKADTQQQGEH